MKARRTRMAAFLAALFVASCTQIVGPARTQRDYQLKAATTADSVHSSVQTARLLMRFGREGKSFAGYLSTMASESEDGATAAAGTFSGIQPPDRRADRLRHRLLALLGPATADLAAVRIRARRTQLGHPDLALERALARDERRLDAFVEEYG
ncbi:MAG: hypothetical protein ACXV9S_03190 [Acidimicrobiia bacterium]